MFIYDYSQRRKQKEAEIVGVASGVNSLTTPRHLSNDGYGEGIQDESDRPSSSFTTETHCSTSSDCSWSQVTTVGDLTGRSGHSGLVFDKKMWVFGGYDNNTSYFSPTR